MPGRETEGNLFERVRAEKRAAPIVGNESKVWVGAGLSPATYELRVKGQGPRAKGQGVVLGSYGLGSFMHEMAWAQQRPKLRTRKCGYGKTLQVTFWQELLHQENAYSTTLASSKIP